MLNDFLEWQPRERTATVTKRTKLSNVRMSGKHVLATFWKRAEGVNFDVLLCDEGWKESKVK